MAKIRPLRNAPVTEAVVEIVAAVSAPPNEALFRQFAEEISQKYPHAEQRRQISFQLNMGADGDKKPEALFVGNLFRSADKVHAVQTKPSGISYSRLKPYGDWDAVMEELWSVWLPYNRLFKPQKIARISTRFINRLEFPEVRLNFDDYLLIAPRLPQGLPDIYASFSTATTIPLDQSTNAIVRTVFDSGAVKDAVPVLLDIDVVRHISLDANDDRSLKAEFEALRPIKNQAFFGSLTEKAIEVFA
jgi:uncharacterized protein (TIGR04255 family)